MDTVLFADEKTDADSETEWPQAEAVCGKARVSDLGLLTLNPTLFLHCIRLRFFPLSLRRPFREGIRGRGVNMVFSSKTLMMEVPDRAPGGRLLGSNHSSVTDWLCDLRHQGPSVLSLHLLPHL